MRDPIWPLGNAGPEMRTDYRLGLGRALNCTDVFSTTCTTLTALLCGDRGTFKKYAAPELSFRVNALGIDTSTADAAWEQARAPLLKLGALISANSPIVDHGATATSATALMHAHLYDVATRTSTTWPRVAEDGTGRPTAHFALSVTYVKPHGATSWQITALLADTIWLASGAAVSEGMAFDAPELTSLYDRSLIFVKGWEADDKEGLATLISPDVSISAPRDKVKEAGIGRLLAYRGSLGALGTLTLTSCRISEAGFSANLHEYGADGMPASHHGLELGFSTQADGSRLISRVLLDKQYPR